MPDIRLHVGGSGGRISLRPSGGGHLRVTGDWTGMPAPTYQGPYTVTPTQSAQVLPTEGTRMAHDVVVEAIPSNYGLITWNGSVLRVS